MWSALTSKLPLRTSSVTRQSIRQWARSIGTDASEQVEPNTYYRITLRRSAISLPSNIKGTLVALGIHRRMQTVYHRHSPDIAGKILRVKELVQVENVPASAVRTKTEQRQERKASRGYQKVASRIPAADL
ncbi:hypothetical protein DAEQUDRAFT_683755 [Daedalea quercina L-15889]|uniref:Large ribosomal subunit protein uL30m n=1 Tax=Daedalea quercina L-15889 TaxID=1314783 RepID=A0A165TJ79_9APHY|nr:hypothetical protein DAEQUDRAFT_683755 [Daedalea quercina L-15889]